MPPLVTTVFLVLRRNAYPINNRWGLFNRWGRINRWGFINRWGRINRWGLLRHAGFSNFSRYNGFIGGFCPRALSSAAARTRFLCFCGLRLFRWLLRRSVGRRGGR